MGDVVSFFLIHFFTFSVLIRVNPWLELEIYKLLTNIAKREIEDGRCQYQIDRPADSRVSEQSVIRELQYMHFVTLQIFYDNENKEWYGVEFITEDFIESGSTVVSFKFDKQSKDIEIMEADYADLL